MEKYCRAEETQQVKTMPPVPQESLMSIKQNMHVFTPGGGDLIKEKSLEYPSVGVLLLFNQTVIECGRLG